MRGQIFNIDGISIFTFGGGESDDREVRSAEEHGIWFKEELPTPDQLAVGAHNLDAAGLKVDYIITHEPPLLVKSSMLFKARSAREGKQAERIF